MTAWAIAGNPWRRPSRRRACSRRHCCCRDRRARLAWCRCPRRRRGPLLARRLLEQGRRWRRWCA
ncbi:MAG: hypothetical protein MZW92_60220 [Comamonadaceae bacterium]|nr:hypothetical protein [Comamonadaceae bacterium]